jgi:flagellar biosynthesis protein FlhG
MERNKKLGRGLQDFSHLFLSRKADSSVEKDPDKITKGQHDEVGTKNPYAIAISCSNRSIANAFLTYNLCVDFMQRGHQVMVINADLSISSINLLNALEKGTTCGQPDYTNDSIRKANSHGAKVMTLDMDVTVLHSPWHQEKNFFLSELRSIAKQSDIILVNTSIGFSANAKAIFKTADVVLLVSSIEPARLIETYRIAKTIIKISKTAPIGIVILGSQEEALKGFEKINTVTNQFLGRGLAFYGHIPFDPEIAKSVIHKVPFIKMKPDCPATRCFRGINEKLTQTKSEQNEQHAAQENSFVDKLLGTSGQAMHFDDTLMHLALFGWNYPELPNDAF